MSNETKKQSFIAEAVYQLSACAVNCEGDPGDLAEFEKLAIQYLKESFKNGLKAGYRKAKRTEAEGQHEAQ